MAIVYPAYEAELSKRNALDFNSLIFKAYELFTTFPAFAKRYRTVYRYICIDEFQDTNHAQYRLIRTLTENNTLIYSSLLTTTRLFTNGTEPATNAFRNI